MHSRDTIDRFFIDNAQFNSDSVKKMNRCLMDASFREYLFESDRMHDLSQRLVGLMMNGVPDGNFSEDTPMRIQIHISAVLLIIRKAGVTSPDFIDAINSDPSEWMHSPEFREAANHAAQMVDEEQFNNQREYEVPFINWVRDFMVELESMAQEFESSPPEPSL